ncbi:hypothetical protein NPIL_263331 [Nephila pilipes]|uniref:Uncharacterized protein n=1 Tax=Nephila pilipes TaxID=299642 RepID=A0A8X6QYN1_NEPPI|nr:hypothetical protein NPIL_263331 [Nephila pilipes]
MRIVVLVQFADRKTICYPDKVDIQTKVEKMHPIVGPTVDCIFRVTEIYILTVLVVFIAQFQKLSDRLNNWNQVAIQPCKSHEVFIGILSEGNVLNYLCLMYDREVLICSLQAEYKV